MIQKLMFNPDFRIVSMILYRDHIYLATEYSVYSLHVNDLTNEQVFVEIAELENKRV